MADRAEQRRLQSRVKDLTAAVTADDLATVTTIVKADPVTITGSDVALLEACKLGRIAILRHFLDHGASVEALGYPSLCDRRPLTSVLGRNKNNPDWTADHRACLDLLLERGASTDYQPGWAGHSAITAAASADNTAALVVLLPRRGGTLDIYESAALGALDSVRRCIATDPRHATRPNAVGMTALQYCAHSAIGATDPDAAARLAAIATLLLDHGADIASQRQTQDACSGYDAVKLAGRIANEAVLAVCARRGGGRDEIFRTAVFHQLMGVLAALEETHASLPVDAIGDDRRQNVFLNECCRWGLLSSADWLLDHGADPNRPDILGWTALHYAARRGVRPALIQRLLDAGGDPTRRGKQGETPADLTKKPELRRLLRAA